MIIKPAFPDKYAYKLPAGVRQSIKTRRHSCIGPSCPSHPRLSLVRPRSTSFLLLSGLHVLLQIVALAAARRQCSVANSSYTLLRPLSHLHHGILQTGLPWDAGELP